MPGNGGFDADVTVADHSAAGGVRHALPVELLSPDRIAVVVDVFRRGRRRVFVVRDALAVRRGSEVAVRRGASARELFSVVRHRMFRFGVRAPPAEHDIRWTGTGQPIGCRIIIIYHHFIDSLTMWVC